jgi:predicted acetyltransferase
MPTSTLRLATADDRPLLDRLWLMFRHDMSEYRGTLPNVDGTFRSERLVSALQDPDRAAYVLMSDEHPVGLAFVRGLSGQTRVLNSFFVVRGARRRGLGMDAVREITGRHPGHWEVAFQDDNDGAARFWRRVATDIAGAEWALERRAVRGRPELAPDTWISFVVR